MTDEDVNGLVARLRADLDEARVTNRKLNRDKQQLESDIARDRHIISEFHATEMDRCYLALHHERRQLRAELTQLRDALSRETEECAQVAESVRGMSWGSEIAAAIRTRNPGKAAQ